MKTLTIFTPAYNRAHTLSRTYESMCRQTCHDVEWLVVDDGSSDNTRELVLSWFLRNEDFQMPNENEVIGYSKDAPWLKMHYVYQQNQGMHGAHNTAYDHIITELNTCIDSDDYAPDDCTEKIVNFWKSQTANDRLKYAGIVGLDVYESNKQVIGFPFPQGIHDVTTVEFNNYESCGDKKLVYRTDIVKKYPKYPLFQNERYVGLDYLYVSIDQDYRLLVLNEPLVIVDYQIDGSSFGMYRQYWNNPNGWVFYRAEMMKMRSSSLAYKFKQAIHYVSSCIRAKKFRAIYKSPAPLITLFVMPLGCALYFYIKHKVQTHAIMK